MQFSQDTTRLGLGDEADQARGGPFSGSGRQSYDRHGVSGFGAMREKWTR